MGRKKRPLPSFGSSFEWETDKENRVTLICFVTADEFDSFEWNLSLHDFFHDFLHELGLCDPGANFLLSQSLFLSLRLHPSLVSVSLVFHVLRPLFFLCLFLGSLLFPCIAFLSAHWSVHVFFWLSCKKKKKETDQEEERSDRVRNVFVFIEVREEDMTRNGTEIDKRERVREEEQTLRTGKAKTEWQQKEQTRLVSDFASSGTRWRMWWTRDKS